MVSYPQDVVNCGKVCGLSIATGMSSHSVSSRDVRVRGREKMDWCTHETGYMGSEEGCAAT
jgi:hypothetical protein